jgi:type II secretory pathway pseudopilin PulG
MLTRSTRPPQSGATLIEILVAIAMIGLLLSVSIPAVQSARESARRTECQNHLRQIALASLTHEQGHRHLPTGGWGWGWQGDPDRGFGRHQPGGWPYQLLPFLEQEPLREAGAGETTANKRAAVSAMCLQSLPMFHCPSRRAAVAYPFVVRAAFNNIDPPTLLARGDYAANVGSLEPRLYGPGPDSLAEGDRRAYPWRQLDRNGVIFRRSEVRLSEVLDGASQTYLIGEGYLQIEHYQTGAATNDNQGLYVGYDRDTLRTTHVNWPPLRDRRGLASDHSFGSAHAAGFHASFCDASVRTIRYSISPEVHQRLGSRSGGESADVGSL